uniref:Uncharacterized protein n=1 Tax=Anguilla anguilla TaxID=7936 RepID=A0A0E9Y270_ANGAN
MNKINFVVFLIAGLQVAGIEMWQNVTMTKGYIIPVPVETQYLCITSKH